MRRRGNPFPLKRVTMINIYQINATFYYKNVGRGFTPAEQSIDAW